MRCTSSWRDHARSVAIALLLLAGATEAYGTDTYSASNNQLSIPAVVIGSATYSNVVVTVGSILSVQQGTPSGSEDTYNPANNQLFIPSVNAFGKNYTNVFITIAVLGLVSIGSVSGADSYNPANGQLTIPNVTVVGGALDGQSFCNAVVTPGSVVAENGELPQIPEDAYNPANQRLNIPAVTVLGNPFVYTNVAITVANVLSFSGCGTGATRALTAAQGDQQIALAGTPLPEPLVAVATVNGIDTPNVIVTFSDGGRGGTFEPQTVTTDASGSAATSYTLPAAAQPITITAASPGYSSATFTETATDPSTKLLCATTNLASFPSEPQPQPEDTCSSVLPVSVGVFSTFETWGKLDVNLCNVDGIPANEGVSCVDEDPSSAVVTLSYSNSPAVPQITATLVEELHTAQGFVLNSCSNTGVGNVAGTPVGDGEWQVAQTTADFTYGSQVPPNQCSVLLTDPNGLAVLVVIGFQISAHCSNAECN
jgi:hypothetical protein